MNSHKHARLTAKGRALLVRRVLEEGWKVAAAAEAAGVSGRTAYKWLARFKFEGLQGLADRSSRPRRSPSALTGGEQGQLEALRRQRWPLWRIAQAAGRGLGTISRCMKRLGLSRLKALELPEPVVRYERATAGELLHIDTNRLGRIDGVGHRITGDRALNRLRRAGHRPHQDPALHAQDERQGRALRADQPARVGLRQTLRQLSPARGRLAALPSSLQLAPATLRTQPPATHEPHPGHEQPPGTRQLVQRPGIAFGTDTASAGATTTAGLSWRHGPAGAALPGRYVMARCGA
jgi:transposase